MVCANGIFADIGGGGTTNYGASLAKRRASASSLSQSPSLTKVPCDQSNAQHMQYAFTHTHTVQYTCVIIIIFMDTIIMHRLKRAHCLRQC